MSLRGLLVLSVLLIAAVCLVVWVDRPKPEDAAKPAEQGALLSFDPADVRRIEIDRSSGTVALERAGKDAWSLVAPRRVEADPARVDDLLRSLHDARTVAVVEEKGGDESRFGLAPPELAVRLTLAKEPAARTLRLGRKSPVGLERYAAAGDGRILLADASLASALERSPDDLEEKRLLPVAAEDVRRILVKRPDGSLVLQKAGAEWRLTEPMRDAADASAADALARSLVSLSVTKRLAPDEAKRAGAPSIEIELETGAGGRRVVIHVGRPGEEAVAARDDGSLAGTIAEGAMKELDRKPDDLRDHRVAILPEGIRAVSIETAGKKVRAWREKDDAPWQVAEGGGAGVPADATKVDGWLDRLRWARAEAFETAEGFRAAHVVAIEGASGEIGRLEIAEASADKVAVRSSFRPGAVLTVPAEGFAPIPSTVTDFAKAPPGVP